MGTRLCFSLLLLLAALAAGACHRKRTPTPAATAVPPARAGAGMRPAPLRTPPRPFTAAAKTWSFESQTHPASEPASPPPKPQPSTADTTVYDMRPGRLPMWRQRAKNY